VEPPKIERKKPSTPPEHTTTATTVSSKWQKMRNSIYGAQF
jgi:hypothetical protein